MDGMHDCSLTDVARWIGMASGAGQGITGPHGLLSARRLRAGDVLVHEHQLLDHFYVVGAGAIKLFKVDEDGFEQVTGFALRGDVVGLDACSAGRHTTNALALNETTVVALARWSSLRDVPEDGGIWQMLQHASATELQRRTETQHLIAPAYAEVRVARFLMHFARRRALQGGSERRFELPMGRRDIASYLGLAHETVSRSFSLLQSLGCIVARLREVEVLDPARLLQIGHATRGPSAAGELKRQARARMRGAA